MTENKRFKITKSKLVENAHVIEDKEKQFTFPTLVGDDRGLMAYKKALNKLSEENRNLKRENELKSDFRNFINEDIVRIKNENEELKKEIKKFKCINKQLEERLDKDIALNMDCSDDE